MNNTSAAASVVLVNPSWRKRTGSMLAAMPDLYPPMGVGCVAAALRHAGLRPTILDLPIMGVAEDDDDQVLGLLRAAKPDIVGFTAVTMTYPTVRRLAQKLRAQAPHLPFIVGGIHVTDAPELTLADPTFDYSVAGEGEDAAVELCRGLSSGETPCANIPGVGYHRADTPYRVPRANVDLAKYPATAYDLYDLPTYLREYQRMSIMTQRGCNARCIFCSAGYSMPRVKFMPIERVMSELEFLVRETGFKFINVYDSNFTYSKEWVHRICDEIIRRGLSFRWRCFSKANGVDLALFEKMRAAGCSHILFGVESSHDVTLQTIRKGNTRADVTRAFALARQAGIRRIAYSIVGLPGEDREMIEQTIRFLAELDAEWNVISPISLMPGTPLHDRMQEYRMAVTEADWQMGSQGHVTATNSLLAPDEIESLVESAFATLNNGRQTYDWHHAVQSDPGVCPHIAMMSMVDRPSDTTASTGGAS
jgi:radical SAM superfamily enzyme YgiQ (UPF0313 family)